MFSRPDVVSLTTWPAGHLFGLEVRWRDVSEGRDEFVEIYRRRDPDVARWRLWKPAIDVVLMREMSTDRVVQVATIALALAAILANEIDQSKTAARPPTDNGLHQ